MQVHDNWQDESDDTCATFISPKVGGALQVSAARNSDGPATDDDLRDFAQEHFDAGAPIAEVIVGGFRGYYLHCGMDEFYQRQWWLRNVDTVVMITYTCDARNRGVDDSEIDSMVVTLERKEEAIMI
jgi:hypothetical protein